MDERISRLWSETLPALLLAPTEQRFDEILAIYQQKREEMGYQELMEKKTAYMKEAKEKLGIK